MLGFGHRLQTNVLGGSVSGVDLWEWEAGIVMEWEAGINIQLD